MNKIREFIRKHKKIIIALMIPCSFLPLIIVHVLFKWRSGIDFLVAEWSAGELLGYIGTLMSFWGTMDEYLKSTNKAVFVWLTPGKGNLELQSKAKMDKYIHGSNTKLLSDIMSSGFEENGACFINWEKLTTYIQCWRCSVCEISFF